MIEKIPLPSKEELFLYLTPDFENGLLFWNERTPDMFAGGDGSNKFCKSPEWNCNVWNKNNAGKLAFTSIANTYKSGSINKIKYKAHRILFKMYYGYDPDEIDHIDGNPLNNCISNLRDCSRLENMKNVAMQHDNTSGQTGVCFDKARMKWSARIECEKKVYYLGRFDTFEEAVNVRLQAEKELKFHENHAKRKSAIRAFLQSRKELNS